MVFTKLFVTAVAALSFALPVVSAPIPRFDAAPYEFFHARSHHVAIAQHKRDVVARSTDDGASLSSTSHLRRDDDDDDDDDGTCSGDDSEDNDNDVSCGDGSESTDDADGDDDSTVDDSDGDDGQSSSSSATTLNPAPTTASDAPAASPDTSKNNGGGSSSSGGQTNTGTATFFYQDGNAGACGNTNPDSALIGAMNTAQFEGGAVCGKHVQITDTQNGQVITIQVADECPSCAVGDIDLSTGAFSALDPDMNDGVFSIEWFFTD